MTKKLVDPDILTGLLHFLNNEDIDSLYQTSQEMIDGLNLAFLRDCQATCGGCQNGCSDQLSHMGEGGCLSES